MDGSMFNWLMKDKQFKHYWSQMNYFGMCAFKNRILNQVFISSSDIKTRKSYVGLVESVKDNGGVVKIFSSMHVSGERMYYFVQ
jgi:protein pelota